MLVGIASMPSHVSSLAACAAFAGRHSSWSDSACCSPSTALLVGAAAALELCLVLCQNRHWVLGLVDLCLLHNDARVHSSIDVGPVECVSCFLTLFGSSWRNLDGCSMW